jgi:hypothetical protein
LGDVKIVYYNSSTRPVMYIVFTVWSITSVCILSLQCGQLHLYVYCLYSVVNYICMHIVFTVWSITSVCILSLQCGIFNAYYEKIASTVMDGQ